MQAPHSESSHPSFEPVRPTSLRTASSRLAWGSSSTAYAVRLTCRVAGTFIAFDPHA